MKLNALGISKLWFGSGHFFCAVFLILAACSSNPPAPVIARDTSVSKPSPTKPAAPKTKTTTVKDWRPDSYTVKKGDTLYSIGLEYGYDYKEIAQSNQISPPYTIRVGQKLNFSALNKEAAKEAAQESGQLSSGKDSSDVVVSPLKNEPSPANIDTPPLITGPKAKREVYSDAAFNAPAAPAAPTVIKPASKPATDNTAQASNTKIDSKKTELDKEAGATKTAESKPVLATDLGDWAWPAQGKLLAKFNESSNKGIDIGGTLGQAVTAANAGKVIYSGSDLRSYGKMVIIKHNSQYLSVYAHNNQILVKEGQVVSKGQKIAEMGKTDSPTIKLHFEIRQQGKSVDPLKYLP